MELVELRILTASLLLLFLVVVVAFACHVDDTGSPALTLVNRCGGLLVRAFASLAGDRGIETKDIKIGTRCFPRLALSIKRIELGLVGLVSG